MRFSIQSRANWMCSGQTKSGLMVSAHYPLSKPFGTFGGSFVMTGFAHGPNGFVGVGYTGEGLEYHPAVVMTSTGGSNWIELSSTTCEDGLNAVTYGNGLSCCRGRFQDRSSFPQNTTNWTAVTPDPDEVLSVSDGVQYEYSASLQPILFGTGGDSGF